MSSLQRISLVALLLVVCSFPAIAPAADTYSASVTGGNTTLQEQINILLAQIAILKAKIAALIQQQNNTPTTAASWSISSSTPAIPAPHLCELLTRTLSQGSSGQDVTDLQYFLQSLGFFKGVPTGVFDAETELAVKQFQASYGIVSSGNPSTTGWGVMGPKSREFFRNKWCVVTLPPVIIPPTDSNAPATSSSSGGVVCTQEYAPVCARIDTQTPQTYSNRCMMNAAKAKYLHDGTCTDAETGAASSTIPAPSTTQSPVISSFTGPSALNAGTAGTWVIKATSPVNATLSYFINWGDQTASSTSDAYAQQSSSTFTHTYTYGGTFPIFAKVIDSNGNMSIATRKVTITVVATSTATSTSSTTATSTATTTTNASCVTPWGNVTVAHGATKSGSPYFSGGGYTAAQISVMYKCSNGQWIYLGSYGSNGGGLLNGGNPDSTCTFQNTSEFGRCGGYYHCGYGVNGHYWSSAVCVPAL